MITSPPNIWLPKPLKGNLLDYSVRNANEQETHKTLSGTKDKLKARITAAFIDLNKESVGKACRRLRSRLEAAVEAKRDFFE